MIKNKPLIDKVIQGRNKKKDPVIKFAVRNKASPINIWCKFKPYTLEAFNQIYNSNIDGVKLKFRFTTLTINGRHKSK